MTSSFSNRWVMSRSAGGVEADCSFITPRAAAPVTSSTSQMPPLGLGPSGGSFGSWILALPPATSIGSTVQLSGAGPIMGSVGRTWQDFERVMDNADTQQQQLFHVQWGLIKEQMTAFSRDVEVLAAEIGAVRSDGSKAEGNLRQQFNAVLQSIEAQVTGRLDNLENSHHEHAGFLRDGIVGLEGQLRMHHEHIQGLGGLDSKLRQHVEEHLRAHGEAFDSRFRVHAEEHSSRLRDALAGLEGQMRSCYDEHSNRLRDGLASLDGQVRSHHDDFRSQLDEHRREKDMHQQALKTGLDGEKRERDSMHALLERRFAEHQNFFAQERAARDQHHGKFQDQCKAMLGMLESLDQRTSGSHSALQDRLQKHADEHQAALSDADAKMRAEITRSSAEHKSALDGLKGQHSGPLQELDQRMRAEMSRMSAGHQSGLDQFCAEMDTHKAGLEQHAQTTVEHRRALEEMDCQIRQQMASLADDHSSNHNKALGALANLDQELRMELKEQIGAHQSMVAQRQDAHGQDLKSAFAEADQATRAEMAEMKADHEGKCGTLEQMLSNQNGKVDRHMAETAAAHDGHRDALAGSMKSLDGKMREEMARLSSEHRSALEGQGAAREQSTAEHKKQREEMDRQVREQMAKLANDHSSKHAAASEALANLDVQLRREISRTNSSAVEERFQEIFNDHRSQHKALAAKHEDHQHATQSALEALEKELRGEVAKFGSERSALHGELTGLVTDHGRDIERKLAAHRNALDDHRAGLQGTIDTIDASLKKELGRIGGEHGDNHRQLRDAFEAHRTGLSRQQEAERAEREQGRESFLTILKDSDRQVRKEVAALSSEHQASHGKIQNQLVAHAKEHKAGLQAALEEVDGQTKREITRLSAEQSSGHSKFSGMLDEHKSSFEKVLQGERAARDEFGGGHRRALEESERNLRRELERMGGEHAGSHQSLRDSLGEHRRDIDKVLTSDQTTRDEHRNSVLEQLDQLEQQIRREMAQTSGAQGDGHIELRRLVDSHKTEVRSHVQTASEEISADLKKALGLLTEEHAGKHQAMQRSLEQVDRALRGEFSGHKSDFQLALQKALGENSEGLRGTAQQNHQKLLQSLQEHKQILDKNTTQHRESIREYLQQEKMERSRHHTTICERIQSLEHAIAREDDDLRARVRDAEETPGGISRGEFDSEIHRIWQAMDTHTHGIAEPDEIIEERIIVEERMAQPPPPTTVVLEEPMMMPHPPRFSMFGQPFPMVTRAQSYPTAVPTSSFVGTSSAQVTRIR